MAKKKRTNPRKRVATRADVEGAKNEATGNGIGAALVVMFSVLHDKEGWGRKRMETMFSQLNKLSGEVANGNVSLLELESTMANKYGVVFADGARWKNPAPRKHRNTLADVKKAKALAINDGVRASMIVMFNVLQQQGWGKVRLKRLKERIDWQFEAIKEGYVTVADLEQMLKEECRVELVG